MNSIKTFALAVTAALCASAITCGAAFATNPEPIRALYLTDYDGFWHKYAEQTQELRTGLSQYANVDLTVVGKKQADTLDTMNTENFSNGYDVIVYNFCLAENNDYDMIHNMISQSRDNGIPAVFIHCAMHSFRSTSDSLSWWDNWRTRWARWQWQVANFGEDFPHWWEFTGVDSVKHDWKRSVVATQASNHPITALLPQEIDSPRDEVYQVTATTGDLTPLYTAYSPQTRREEVVAWTRVENGTRLFGTTLGHDSNTQNLGSFLNLVGNGILWVTDHLNADGAPEQGYEGNEQFPNYQSTVTCDASQIIEARNIEEVQEAVTLANELDKSLKVVSLNTSNSNSKFICPEHGGILLNVWQMNQVLAVDEDLMTVTVEPGIRATELSEILHGYDLAIRAMPDYTGVSIAGGIATAAHHSSLNIPSSMADMVVGMKIVDGEGNLRVFDEDTVASVATHLGMLGVVVEITLQAEPQFKLSYGHEKGSDIGLEYLIEEKVREHDYARVMWFAGNDRYVMDYYDRVDNDTSGTSQHNLWESSASAFRIAGDIPYRVLNSAPLRAQCDSALLRSMFWFAPIDSQESGWGKTVGWSHEMLGSYCTPGTCPWDVDNVKSRTMEAAFPLADLANWMDDVRGIIDANRACFPVLGLYLRFSKASDRWAAFNYGEDMVAFEIHIPKIANEDAMERSAAVYDEIVQMTIRKYDGRPHWGKNSSAYFVGIDEDNYPKWDDFLELKEDLDPNGLFNNKIWRQLNRDAEIVNYPGCVLARDCICQSDSDCGQGKSCVSGGFYEEARVRR